jgi:hypothetical protein
LEIGFRRRANGCLNESNFYTRRIHLNGLKPPRQ